MIKKVVEESGKGARDNFERTMTALFRVPKSAVERPKPKKASARKELNQK